MKKENIDMYKQIVESYDASWIMSKLETYVDIGSDNSSIFVQQYK